jgi:centractin
LFHPEIIGTEYQGVHEMLYDSINRTDLDLRPNLYGTIILSGGTTLSKGKPQHPPFPIPQIFEMVVTGKGFGQRVKNEMEKLAVKGTKIKIFAPPERKYTTWIGGSILAALGTFRKVFSPISERRLRGVRCGLARRNTRKTQRLSIARQSRAHINWKV